MYKRQGEGTRKLAALAAGDTLTVTGPCGNGFDTAALASAHKRIAVVGGGIGTAPLLLLCKELCRAGVRPDLYVGFRDASYGMESFVPVSYTHICHSRGSQQLRGQITLVLIDEGIIDIEGRIKGFCGGIRQQIDIDQLTVCLLYTSRCV